MGTRNISNNNHHNNSGGNSSNSSNRNAASNNTTFDPSYMWLATSDHMVVPQVIFTDPQIASVGLAG
jgi:pyruvate/2-oxoglutarate dehydrogenase complex dihydrolipoamide dehydrogenase (E3) component